MLLLNGLTFIWHQTQFNNSMVCWLDMQVHPNGSTVYLHDCEYNSFTAFYSNFREPFYVQNAQWFDLVFCLDKMSN
jgi:hypothetical protein